MREAVAYGNSVGLSAVRSFASRLSPLGSGAARWRSDRTLKSAEGGPPSYLEPKKAGCAFAGGAHERSHGGMGGA